MAKPSTDRPQPIAYAELLRRLADPEIPKAALKPYLTFLPTARVGMAPVLVPDPDLVRFDDAASRHARVRGAIGRGFLNSVCKSRRRHRFEDLVRHKDPRPIILAEGDSWFQYPVFLDDVIDGLLGAYNVLCGSAAGDTLSGMLEQDEYWLLLECLRTRGLALRALLLSAGGNDIVEDALFRMLNPHQPGLPAEGHLNRTEVTEMLAQLQAGYVEIITRVHAILPGLPILLHAYDHAIPLTDQGANITPLDGWLGDPMRARGIPDGALQAAIIRLLLDELNDAIAGLAREHPDVHFVDNRGVVGTGGWHDELHPTDASFARVASNFAKTLRTLGI